MAERFGLSLGALVRHRDDHLPAVLRRAHEQTEDRYAINVAKQLAAINGAAIAILQAARQTGDHDIALKACDRVLKQLELASKLSGDLDERPTLNLLVAAEWLSLRAVLFAALQPYPDARTAVAEQLVRLEAGHGG